MDRRKIDLLDLQLTQLWAIGKENRLLKKNRRTSSSISRRDLLRVCTIDTDWWLLLNLGRVMSACSWYKYIDIWLVMVRLEKVIYEKAVNGLSRARAISSPRKWFYANPYENLRRSHSDIQSTITASLRPPFWAESSPPSLNGSINLKWESSSILSNSKDS